MKLFRLALLLFIGIQYSFAQPTVSTIYHGIQKLGVTGTVLYIAAHPDDENTRLITYLANDRLLRTGYLSLTRGDLVVKMGESSFLLVLMILGILKHQLKHLGFGIVKKYYMMWCG